MSARPYSRPYRTPPGYITDGLRDAAAVPFPELRHFRSPEWRRTIAEIGGTAEGMAWAAQCKQEAQEARELSQRFEANGSPERAAAYRRRAELSEFEAAALCRGHLQTNYQSLTDKYRPVLRT